MPHKEEIHVIYRDEKWRSRDGTFMIGNCEVIEDGSGVTREVSFKGNFGEDEFQFDTEYHLYGHFEDYTNKRTGRIEKTFNATHVAPCLPHTREAFVRYLCNAGVSLGAAGAIFAQYGQEATAMLRQKPAEVVAAMPAKYRFTLDKAQACAQQLNATKAVENCSMDLHELLAGSGVPKSAIKEAVRMWGSGASHHIRRNAFALLKIPGCGFAKAYKVYRSLGGDPSRPRCQGLALWYSITKMRGGHTWFSVESAIGAMTEIISGAKIDAKKAVRFARRLGGISLRNDDDGIAWITDRQKAIDEYIVAKRIVDASKEWPAWPVITKEDVAGVSDHQFEQLQKALAGSVCIFGGLPGSGKSHSVAALIRFLEGKFGVGTIACAAPTGKAAVRLTQAMRSNGLSIAAVTCHRLLGVADRGEDGGFRWNHNATNPLPYTAIFIDEVSMASTSMMRAMLDARATGACMMFIGDVNQLPPIEHGAPLRDLIAAGVSYGELTEIHRNAGTGTLACRDIAAGKMFRFNDRLNLSASPPENLVFVQTSNDAQSKVRILDTIRKIRDAGRLDPIWDVQVIVAVNTAGAVNRVAMNTILQGELNPSGATVEGSPFKVGDKVIQLKNEWLPAHDPFAEGVDNDGRIAVANGEFGRVLEVELKRTIVEFSDPKRVVIVPRSVGKKKDQDELDDDSADDEPATGCNLDLGYACTCHKMQGAQVGIALIVIDGTQSGPYGVCSREWLFTAASRYQKAMFMYGKTATVGAMLRRRELPARKTFLVEQIRRYSRLEGGTPLDEEITNIESREPLGG